MPTPENLTPLIHQIGSQALPIFFALLLILLLGASLLWWLAGRYAVPRPSSRLPPNAYLIVRLALGFAVLVGAAALFAEIASALGDGERVGQLDLIFSNAIRDSIGLPALHAFAWLTLLGNTLTITVLCALVAVLLVIQRRRWLALGWTLAITGNALLNTTLKAIFERARPVHDAVLVHAPGWSFPSGHSSGSVVAYGMLAYVVLRSLQPAQRSRYGLLVVLIATTLAFVIGCSRIFIQAHFATDVLAGFASGTAWLAICIGSIELTRHYQFTQA